ncbi:MAG: Rpn family recombination-promoting nuclease/putative transposase, partial [Cellulosilyticaceae bacterium]
MSMKKGINNIHDKTYRSFFENKEIFLELLQSFVKESWADQLNPEGLSEDKSHYVVRDYEEIEADVVYTATIEDQEVIFCILLELQSTVDYSMPIRLFSYTAEIWRKYVKQFPKGEVKKKGFKLPAVIPIVLYNGEPTWTAAMEFKDKIQRVELFGDYAINFKYALINVNNYSKENLIEIENIVSAIFLLDQKIDAQEFIKRAAVVATEFENIPEEQKLRLVDWLDHTTEGTVREAVLKMFKSNLSKEEVGILTANITKTLQEMNERAENAKKNGKIEGKTEEKIGVA